MPGDPQDVPENEPAVDPATDPTAAPPNAPVVQPANPARPPNPPLPPPPAPPVPTPVSGGGGGNPPNGAAPTWKWWDTLAIVLIVAAIIILGEKASPLEAWIGSMLLLIVFLVFAGEGTTGLLRGALIDNRNKMSLSRLQMVLWTVLILSAIVAAALSNVAAGNTNPLDIALPQTLWVLMGISTTSLVGSPLIKGTKTGNDPDPGQLNQTLTLLASQGTDPNGVSNNGQIMTNKSPKSASLSDLFKGEETGNAANLDLAKVQMFFFTIILVIAYGAMLYSQFASDDRGVGIHSFPDVDKSMVALLSISHAGYLTNKAVPHSTSAS